MSLLQPELASRPTPSSKVAGPALVGGAALVLIGSGYLLGSHGSTLEGDPCGLPPGVSLANIPDGEAAAIARQAVACKDLQWGRISLDEYRAIAKAQPPRSVQLVAPTPTMWASQVRGFSTEYTADTWSASRVLGPPDVFPRAGDNVNAWASLTADDQPEWIEVGFDHAVRASAIEIYETYNPGALGDVELITVTGKRLTMHADPLVNHPASAKRIVRASCSTEPIVAVRVAIDSPQVSGWNEIDAIGVVPCVERDPR